MGKSKSEEQLTEDLKVLLPEDTKLIELARAIYTQTKIAGLLGVSQVTVSKKMKKYGILPYQKVKQLIAENPKLSNKDIAQQANVDVEAVKRIRKGNTKTIDIDDQKLEDTKLADKGITQHADVDVVAGEEKRKIEDKPKKMPSQAIQTEEPKRECTKKDPVVTKPQVNKATLRTNQQAKKEGTSTKPIELSQELVKEIRHELAIYSAVAFIAKKLKVSREAVLQVKQQMEQENYDRTHTERDFKIKRMELLNRLKSNINISDVATQVIELKADTLLTEFSAFLTTEEDYKLIAYAYVKAKRYQKAIEIGEEYLGLETPTMEELEKKLRENTLQTDQKKKSEGDIKKTDKKPEDEEFSL